MSHTSHQLHEQSRREQRRADLADGRPDDMHERSSKKDKQQSVKGTAPAAPPAHEDEAFRVSDGDAPQSDG